VLLFALQQHMSLVASKGQENAMFSATFFILAIRNMGFQQFITLSELLQ